MFIQAVWQGLERDSISAGNTRLLMIFIGIAAFSMLCQAVAVVGIAMGAKKAQERLLAIAEELRAKATPLLKKAEDISDETLPKIKTITENLLQTSNLIRAKAQDLGTTVSDVNTRTKAQVARVDGMVSTALTATGTLAAMIHHGIKTPLVEAIGVVNGFKAGIDVFTGKTRSKSKALVLFEDDKAGM